MEILRANDILLLAKKEKPYGIDANPADKANAVLTNSFEITPLDALLVARDLDRPGFGAVPDLVGPSSTRCTFKVEAASSGKAGTAPAYHDLLLASQFAATVTDGEKVVYKPVSNHAQSASLTFFYAGLRQNIMGWMGSMGLELVTGAIPYFTFSGIGFHKLPEEIKQPDADFSKFQTPELVSSENTSYMVFLNRRSPVVNFSVSPADNIGYANLPGGNRIKVIRDRRITGQLEILAAPVGDSAIQKHMKEGTLSPISILHGSAEGKKILVSAPAVQVTGISFGEYEGMPTYRLELLFTASDKGDDEISYTLS